MIINVYYLIYLKFIDIDKMIELNHTFHIEEEDSIFKQELLKGNKNNFNNIFKFKLYYPFDKTILQISENENDSLIDKESKILNVMNFEKEQKLIDLDEDHRIKKESTFISQNDYTNLESIKTIDNKPTNQKYGISEDISNNIFENNFLTNKKESNFNNQKLYFVAANIQNSCPLDKNKETIFSIHKDKTSKMKNVYINITNQKIQDNVNDNVFILIKANNEKDEKRETIFNSKKRNRNIFRTNFEIFNPREYDDYTKIMINEVLNLKNKDKINLRNLFVTKLKKEKKNNRKHYSDDIRKKIKSGFHRILKNILNAKLESAGSTLFFDYLPQVFITNISKKENQSILNLTLELFSLKICF